MWGLDAMALTFVAPHDLRARPFVVPRGNDLHIWNRTPGVGCAVLVDGHRVGDAGTDERVAIGLGEQRSLLGTLPEATFVRRYRQSFGST
jgi:NAD kinase